MKTRIKVTTNSRGKVVYQPQYRLSIFHSWYGFDFHNPPKNTDDKEAIETYDTLFKNNIGWSRWTKDTAKTTSSLERAKEVIDYFLENYTKPSTKYIKYP